MSFKVAEWVQETTTTTGTGTLSLGGAASGCQGIVAAIGTGSTSTFLVTNRAYGGTAWEVFEGVVTDASPDTLTRDVVLASSNGGAAVDLPAGTKDVLLWVPVSQQHLGYTRVRTGDQSGFTNTLTDLTDMSWPVRTGELWFVEGKFNFACSSTQGVAVQIVTPSATGASIHYHATTSANTAYGMNADKNSGELSNNYVAYAGTGFVWAAGYVNAASSGTAKFQGISANVGNTVTFLKGSNLRVTRVIV